VCSPSHTRPEPALTPMGGPSPRPIHSTGTYCFSGWLTPETFLARARASHPDPYGHGRTSPRDMLEPVSSADGDRFTYVGMRP